MLSIPFYLALQSQDLIINHLNQRSLSLDDIRPLGLQKPSGDTTDAYQACKLRTAVCFLSICGYIEKHFFNLAKQYQANRTNRTRHGNAGKLKILIRYLSLCLVSIAQPRTMSW